MGCENRISLYTTYYGTIVEETTLNPIENLYIIITDGVHIYSETYTDKFGKFAIDFAHNTNLTNLFLKIDGQNQHPNLNLDLVLTSEEEYDYGVIFLYNQTDKFLLPTIDNMEWKFPNGDKSIMFYNILIHSEYELLEHAIEISTNYEMCNSKKYELKKQKDGKYSIEIDDLNIGNTYYFRTTATNKFGTSHTQTYCRKYGYSYPIITDCKNISITTATITIKILEEPLTTLSHGICWSEFPNPTISDHLISSSSPQTTDFNMIELNFNTTTYYVKAYAINSNGVAYSDELILPVNNPCNLPTFSVNNETYIYKYMGKNTWYNAYLNCISLIEVFDDWTLPDHSIIGFLYADYFSNHGIEPPLPIWSSRRDIWQEESEMETFLLTSNGLILESKNNTHHYFAIRRFKH